MSLRLDNIVRTVVGIADRVTKSAQVQVDLESFDSVDVHLKPSYSAVVSHPYALVSYRTGTMRNEKGDTVIITAKLTFVADVDVKEQDRITLPGGKQSTVMAVKRSPLDPANAGRGYVTHAWIGSEK